MKNLQYLLLMGMLAFLLGAACSENNPDEMPEPPEEPTLPVDPYDTASIGWVLSQIMNYIPTWEELEKYTDTAQFQPIPSFSKRVGIYGEELGNRYGDDYLGGLLADLDGVYDFFGANESSVGFNDMPPFYQVDEEFIVPYPLDRLDQKLRASVVMHLYESSRGRATQLVNFYPPFAVWGNFATKADFDAWFESKFLPEKEAEAKAAELMKAERFIPWPLELEVMVRKVGGVGNGGFLDGASPEEMLAFGNELKTRIYNTVRPHYSGRLVAHVHNNYFNGPPSDYWDQMTYSEFDEIQFAFFPPFDPETTEAYMDEQLTHYMKILQNSGNLPWLAAEVSVFEWYVENGKMLEHEPGMYQVALEKIDAAPVPPSGIASPAGYMRTEEARQLLKQYLATH